MTRLLHSTIVLLVLAGCSRRTHEENNPPPPPPALVAPAPVAPAPIAPAPVAPAPVAPAQPAATADAAVAAPTAPAVEPPSVPEPSYAADALTEGSHRCAFSEAGNSYSRRCQVTRMPDGSLEIVARGTSLNPQQGFTLNASGAAPRYAVRGELTAFGACTGRVTGTMILEGPDSRPHYEVNWGQGCQITIQP